MGMGHNVVAGDRLRSFVERVERLEEEIAGLNGDKREIYSEAKAAGFDTKIIKQLIRRRRMDPNDREEQDAILHLYEQAVDRSAPSARVHAHESVDPETGEITEQDAPGPSNRDPSTGGEPYPEAVSQDEASPAGTGCGTPASHEGHSEAAAGQADEAAASQGAGDPAAETEQQPHAAEPQHAEHGFTESDGRSGGASPVTEQATATAGNNGHDDCPSEPTPDASGADGGVGAQPESGDVVTAYDRGFAAYQNGIPGNTEIVGVAKPDRGEWLRGWADAQQQRSEAGQ